MSATKTGGNTTNILNCYFSKKITLWHIRLNIYICKTKFPFHKQYLFVLLFSRNQRIFIQTKVYHKFFYSVRKETFHKPLKVAGGKKSFSSVYIIDLTCFDECFLLHVKLSLPRGLLQPPRCYLLWSKCFERSPQFISVISTITLQCY